MGLHTFYSSLSQFIHHRQMAGIGALLLALTAAPAAHAAQNAPVDFDRDVKPILSENCFTCHGFDKNTRMANLRLDTQEGSREKAASGKPAIVPGKPDESELIRRVVAMDALKMPPSYSDKTLTPKQIETLKQWVAEGGEYKKHWAFVAPKRPAPPKVKNEAWVRTSIDRFILARLEKEGLKPNPETDKVTLIRRLSFDLRGLPPTMEEVDAFLADKEPDAYDRLVNRFLDSPHYGERMALKWLDLAGYADTHGYHIDSHRDMWRWREWVINAYNRNLPYDQFIIQQIAGDMLPNPSLEQRIATGFNRNHPINFEGGAIPEEYQSAYVAARVDTTATVMMGLTMKCAQCHDHKYDPISHKDYYQFYAFFNTISEEGLDGQRGNAKPLIQAPYPGQMEQLESYGKRMKEAEKKVNDRPAAVAEAQAKWETEAAAKLEKTPPVTEGLYAHFNLEEADGDTVKDVLGKRMDGKFSGKPAREAGKVGKAIRFNGESYLDLGQTAGFDKEDKFSYGAWVYPTAGGALTVLSRMDDNSSFRGYDLYLGDGKAYVHLIHEWDKNAVRVNTKQNIEMNRWTHLFVTYNGSGKAGGVKIYVDGKPADLDVTHDTLSGTIKTEKPLLVGRRNPGAPFNGLIDEVRIYDRELTTEEVSQLAGFDSIRQILATPADKRNKEQKDTLTRHYLETEDAEYKKLTAELTEAKKRYDEYNATIPTTMVMQEMEKPRKTHILHRGEYNQLGEEVFPLTPEALPAMPGSLPRNRLGLAKWLVDPSHPLTARVAVNRLWEMYFGTGLVKTSEDFGTQGEHPSHPELLDWLATEFIRTGWDVKAFHRMMVTSSAYRQSSKVTPELLERDPENRLIARATRFRIPAEHVRDQALMLSGLLVKKIGGPSVSPYQPAGLWEEISFKGGFTAQFYEQDHGEALYRRSMYTFWKRTVPPPSLQTFDAPEREFCVVRRSVTNTPLQALVLMNDPTYVESSRAFAERIMTEAPASLHDKVKFAFRTALCRNPNEKEIRTLMGIYNKQAVRFDKNQDAAKQLLSVGESPRNEKLDLVEQAAWTTVASVLLNLDETVTRN